MSEISDIVSSNIGWIYCMTNPCMPGLVKVGMTKSPKRLPSIRANELFTTGVPLPFEVALEKLVFNPVTKETSLHNLLSKYSERVNSGREFFKTSVETVKDFFNLIDSSDNIGNIEVNSQIMAAFTGNSSSDSDGEYMEFSSLSSEKEEFWINYPKQKQQLLDWKIEYNKKAQNPIIPKSQHLPSTTAESGSLELKAANLRQRVRARQATPHCWPQNDDDPTTVELKENMIAAVVGGRWFDRN